MLTDDYRKWDSLPREKIHTDAGYRPPTVPFEGASNYQTEYIPHQALPRTSMKPAETARGSDQPFQDQTDYRDSYIKHAMPEKHIREKVTWEGNKAPLDGLSNYQKDYTPKDLLKTESCKPNAQAFQSGAPLDSDTTHRIDYKEWPMGRPFVREQLPYIRPEGNFEGTSTTHNDFTKKPIDRPEMRKPPSARKAPGKFDGATNYREDYRKWPGGDRPRPNMKADYIPNEAPFEGMPTYQRDYIPHDAFPRTSCKPLETARQTNAPFDGSTEYRDDYIKHQLPEREKREKPKWAANTAPLDGMTNYMKDFVPKDPTKPNSFKPNAAPVHSDAPFDDGTIHKQDYKQWPMERPYQREQQVYMPPQGEMEKNTTHNTDYTRKPMEKVTMKRPPSSRKAPGKFDDHTNYREDYRKWAMGDRPKQTMKGEYVPNGAPFEGRTNYQDEYIPRRGQPMRSMKPGDTGYSSNAPFEDYTEYRNEYTKKENPPCPAAILETNQSRFMYQEQDDVGHKWYESKNNGTYSTLPPRTGGMNSATQRAAMAAA